jgi:uncharacterized protein involved in exopolysaccharide biosynthesis
MTEMRRFADDDIDLGEYLVALWNRRWVILAAAVIGVAVAVLVEIASPPTYGAAVTLSPLDTLSEAPLPAAAAVRRFRLILGDVAVLGRALQEAKPVGAGVRPEELRGSDRLTIEASNPESVILTVRTTDPAASAAVVNALARVAIRQDWELRRGQREASTQALQAQLEEAKRRLGEATERFRAAATRAGLHQLANARPSDALEASVLLAAADNGELPRLLTDYRAAQDLYLDLVYQAQSVDVESRVGTGGYVVVKEASRSTVKGERRTRGRSAAVGGLFGFLLGVGAVLLWEMGRKALGRRAERG